MKKLVLTALMTLFSPAVMADQVTLPVGHQTLTSDLELPKQSANKETVRTQFGDPQSIKDEVGDPPISSWEYANFVVYFEHNLVLHTVVKRDSSTN